MTTLSETACGQLSAAEWLTWRCQGESRRGSALPSEGLHVVGVESVKTPEVSEGSDEEIDQGNVAR